MSFGSQSWQIRPRGPSTTDCTVFRTVNPLLLNVGFVGLFVRGFGVYWTLKYLRSHTPNRSNKVPASTQVAAKAHRLELHYGTFSGHARKHHGTHSGDILCNCLGWEKLSCMYESPMRLLWCCCGFTSGFYICCTREFCIVWSKTDAS